MIKPKAWLSWSSGKDSAWALKVTREMEQVEVAGLLTTVNTTHDRVAMHAVREVLLEMQAAAVGLPLLKVRLPWPCPNDVYECQMSIAMQRARHEDVSYVVFGDLFLEDIRRYREEKLAPCKITPLFPLWGRDTTALAEEMIAGGLRAYLTCVDPRKIESSFAGRSFDSDFLRDLPEGVDPCGENGEFHTFVYAGPMFQSPLGVETADVVQRDGFVFADVVPLEGLGTTTTRTMPGLKLPSDSASVNSD
ncbi:MAG: adenine nucleotide alpha hydrolase [Acidobacteria bacterium]|nr:adenine nucleotide alpha hydrolase [Acidobacteriota bacterium]